MQQTKHIFFDLDHTLWDFEANSKQAFISIFNEHQISIEINDFLKIYIPLNLEYWRLYREDKITKDELRYQRLKKTFDALNYSISDEFIDTLAIDYINELPKSNILFDGTKEILKYLSKKYTLHIITNGFKEVQDKKMKTSGIYDFFNVIITAESVGVKKPNPKIFYEALKRAGAIVENSVMIGDSIEADVLGAQALGIKAIHCNFNHSEAIDNTIQITELKQLKQYF